MTALAIRWDPAALAVFFQLRVQTATAIDRAVIHLAQTGEGRLEWVAPYHRLRVGGHELALSIDRTERTLAVIRIYRAR